MGIAVIVPNVSFADANLGKVSIISNVPLQELNIVADNYYIGTKAQLALSFLPFNTGQRGVTWSITAGGSYATIDNNGLITILSTATSKKQITVEVSSVENPNITAQKDIYVFYNADEPVFAVDKVFNYTAADAIKSNTFKPLSASNTAFTMFADIVFGSGVTALTNQAFGQYISGSYFGFGCNGQSFNINGHDKVTLNGVTKMGVKREGNTLYYTTDGITWTSVGEITSFDNGYMPIGTAVTNGVYINLFKGSMRLYYWNKVVDLSAYFV